MPIKLNHVISEQKYKMTINYKNKRYIFVIIRKKRRIISLSTNTINFSLYFT